MGSKSPNGEYEGYQGHLSNSDAFAGPGGQPRGEHASRDGDGCLGSGGGGDDDEDDDANANANGNGNQITPAVPEAGLPLDVLEKGVDADADADAYAGAKSKTSKKKKKPKKKAKAKAKSTVQQSSPPRVPVSDLFPSGVYPEGERQAYQREPHAGSMISNAEARYDHRQQYWEDKTFLQNYRKAAEVHRQARQWIRETVKPGRTLHEIADEIEDSVRALLDNAGLEPGASLKSGMGFPTGLCLNQQVAHYTPNPGQKEVVLKHEDVLTVDFGVHINGWIVDSAFTMAFDPTYDNLLAAVRDATNTGIKTAGIDVRISDVSAAIQETMESYEVTIRGKTYPVKPIRNLSGHNIGHYHIHGGKSIPFIKNSDQTKMEEGEVFAIETFGSTGRGVTYDDVGTYGYGLNYDAPLRVPLALTSAKRLHKTIRENFGTLVFNRRYLERLGVDRYLAGMSCLVSNGIVEQYVPLTDIKGSYSAQFEHTFLLHATHKEVLSRGDDY